MTNHTRHPGRRDFLRAATAVSAAACIGLRTGRAGAEPPPETTTLKLVQLRSRCQGPIHVAEELLRGEGFTDVSYVKSDDSLTGIRAVETRAADIGLQFAAPFLTEVDRGAEVVTLGGVHAGCYALRLHEAGLVKSSPSKLLAQGSELRFVKELKKELKG